MVREELRDLERVGRVLRRAQRKRLDALQEDPGRVGGERRPLVAEADCAEAQDEREVERQVMCETEPMVATVGLIVERELRVLPVEGAGVDHLAADARAMAADPL